MHAPLLLDARRHAMLKAMGLEPWWMPPPPPLQPQPAAQPVAAPVAPAAVAAGSSKPPTTPIQASSPATLKAVEHPATVAPPPPPPSVAPPPPSVVSAVSPAAPGVWFCQPPLPVFDVADAGQPENTRWLFVTDDFADAGVDAPQVQQLFHNMLRAMGLFQRAGVWLGHMQRAAPDAQSHATAITLESVAQTLRPQIVVLMGRVAAQTLLQNRQPLGLLRQTPHQVCGMPVLATYSPGYLLHAPHAKAGAWADLRQALRMAAQSPAT